MHYTTNAHNSNLFEVCAAQVCRLLFVWPFCLVAELVGAVFWSGASLGVDRVYWAAARVCE